MKKIVRCSKISCLSIECGVLSSGGLFHPKLAISVLTSVSATLAMERLRHSPRNFHYFPNEKTDLETNSCAGVPGFLRYFLDAGSLDAIR